MSKKSKSGMSCVFVICMGMFLSSCAMYSVQRDYDGKISKVAVLPFRGAGGGWDTAFANQVESALINCGMKVVDRNNLDQILKEKNLTYAGLVGEQAREVGNLLNIDGFVVGSSAPFNLDIKLIDVASGEVVATSTGGFFPGPYEQARTLCHKYRKR